MNKRLLALLVMSAAACASHFDTRLVDAPIAKRSWMSPDNRSHPLVGKIWDARAERFVDEATLRAAVASADFVLLGEVHDNPDHHVLQARLVRAITETGRRPALAFEMLTADQQAAVDATLARAPKDPDAMATPWTASHWPDFQYYRPIIAVGLEAGLPIIAANLPREQVTRIIANGREGLDEDLKARLAREEPIPEPMLAALREEMNQSHCGELPRTMLDPLVLTQRARDARMAERLATAGAERGAILITGNGHARVDRGVPAVLAKDAPAKKIVSVSFEEARSAWTQPAAYVQDWGSDHLPFDFVVFTPKVKRTDPCAGIRAHMQKKREEAEKKEAEKKDVQGAPDQGGAPSEPAKSNAP